MTAKRPNINDDFKLITAIKVDIFTEFIWKIN